MAGSKQPTKAQPAKPGPTPKKPMARLSLGGEGNGVITLITLAVVVFLIVWGYFVFDFLGKTYVTMRAATPTQRQAQNILIDVKQAQQTANEIEQGKLY